MNGRYTIPTWAQPIFTPNPYCSICGNKDVYFEIMDSWVENIPLPFELDMYVECKSYGMKRYCKECFEEYGGSAINIQQ